MKASERAKSGGASVVERAVKKNWHGGLNSLTFRNGVASFDTLCHVGCEHSVPLTFYDPVSVFVSVLSFGPRS